MVPLRKLFAAGQKESVIASAVICSSVNGLALVAAKPSLPGGAVARAYGVTRAEASTTTHTRPTLRIANLRLHPPAASSCPGNLSRDIFLFYSHSPTSPRRTMLFAQ